ncbi:MAG: hypothetical protein R3F17_07460 [Planctomycetota bacterium]
MLEFNQRCAGPGATPIRSLLERLFFLTITSTNLDEFFEVRAAPHRERPVWRFLRTHHRRTHFGGDPRCHAFVAINWCASSTMVLNRELLPALQDEGHPPDPAASIGTIAKANGSASTSTAALPVLTPIGLDPHNPPAHPQ